MRSKYSHVRFKSDWTYLFEIIFPANRIVVDYGQTEDLFLLAIIDTATGKDLPLEDIGMPIVKQFDGLTDLAAIRAIQDPLNEGFVLRFESGLRIKVKFEEYKRLHKLLTGVSPRFIWETLRDKRSFEEIIDRVPDEFYNWATDLKNRLLSRYSEIEQQCKADFKDLGDRKQTAMYFKTCEHPSVLFSMLDGKPYDDYIWKIIRPLGEQTFKRTEI